MMNMWIDDVKVGSDTRPVGFHKFKCDLLLLRAVRNIEIEGLNGTEKHAIRDKLMGSPPGWAMDCSPEQYEEWAEWVDGDFILKDINADHVGIKSNRDALDAIWAF